MKNPSNNRKFRISCSNNQNCTVTVYFAFQDEVVEGSRQVVVECSKFLAWECTSDSWHKDLSNTIYSEIDLDKLQALNRDKQSIVQRNKNVCCKVKILTFPQYNRYKTCMRMLKLRIPMTYFQLLARGGLDISNMNTIILFSKRQCEKDDLESYSPTLDIPGNYQLQFLPCRELKINKKHYFEQFRLLTTLRQFLLFLQLSFFLQESDTF